MRLPALALAAAPALFAAIFASAPAHADIKWNGLTLNGLTLNGAKLNGLTLNGARLNGVEKGATVAVTTAITLPSGEVLELKR